MTVPGRVRLLAVVIGAVFAFAVVLTATGTPGETGPDRRATFTLDGTAEIEGADGLRQLRSGDHDIADGEQVELLSGTGVVQLSADRALELRISPGGEGSRIEVAPVPTVEAGDVLALAGDEELVVASDGARLTLTAGAARISRGTGTTVALYRGRAGLTSGGRTLEGGLPPLRQVVVTGTGMVPLSVSPLRFAEPPDPWDRRFLGEAIDLQAILERRSAALTTLLRDDFTPDVFFYQAVLPGLLHEPAFDQALLDGQDRPVGEILVGAALAVVGDKADFAARWRSVFDLRTQGAGWGVVAFDQGAPRVALLSALDGVADRSPLLFAPPSSEDIFGPPPPPVRRLPLPPPLPAAPPVVVPGPAAPVAPRPPAPVPIPPPAGADADTDEGLLEPVVDPLVDLLDGVLDGLGDLTDGLL